MENPVLTVVKPSCNPWGTSSKTAPCSLISVMDEELAKELENQEGIPVSVSATKEGLERPFDTSLEGMLMFMFETR